MSNISNTTLLIILLVLYSSFGAVLIVLYQYLDQEKFSHSWFLNLVMFLAEILALPFYYIMTCRKKKKQKKESEDDQDNSEEQEEIPLTIRQKLLLIIPCILDAIASFIITICVYFFAPILYIMFKGILLNIITCLISRFILKNKHTWDHYIAILIAFIGLFFSCLSAFFGPKQDEKEDGDYDIKNLIIGFITAFISVGFQSVQFCFEEYYMRKYSVHPFLCIGIEGVFGFIINLILCIIFYFIKCSENKDNFFKNLCIEDDNGNWRIENVIYALKKFENNTILMLIIILFILLIFYNVFGISITKYGGALTLSLIENFKSLLSWLIFLIPQPYDELEEKFNIFRFVGMLFVFISILFYFGIFKIDECIMIRRKMKALNNMDDLNDGIINPSRNDLSYSSDMY